MTELNSQWACESVKNAYQYVFRLQSLSSRAPPGVTEVSSFIFLRNRATVVSRVLFLTLISFSKNAAKRAVGECLAEVLFLKENKSTL